MGEGVMSAFLPTPYLRRSAKALETTPRLSSYPERPRGRGLGAAQAQCSPVAPAQWRG